LHGGYLSPKDTKIELTKKVTNDKESDFKFMKMHSLIEKEEAVPIKQELAG
jgi:hypothetical protein